MNSIFIIIVGIVALIITIIVVSNVIKTARNTELIYQLLKLHFDKLNQDESTKIAKNNTKQFEGDIHEVWNKIQEQNK